MPEIRKIIGIKKRNYRFDLRKRYFNKKKYAIAKKNPLQQLLGNLNEAFNVGGPRTAAPRRRMLPLVFGIVLVIAILGYFIMGGQAQPARSAEPILIKSPAIDMFIRESGIASFGTRKQNPDSIAYYNLQYSLSDADSFNVTTETYNEHVPNQAFILVSKRSESESYPQFMHSLKKRLDSYGMPLNEITLGQLETLPEGAILIVPSGVIPERLVETGSTGEARIVEMAKRGVDVIYIGETFGPDDFAIDEAGNQVSIGANISLPFRFVISPVSPDGLKIKNGGYKVYGRENQPAMSYGVVSTVSIGRGYILFIPQVLDSGWKSYDDAASDLETIITDMSWRPPGPAVEASLDASAGKKNALLISAPFAEREKTIVLKLNASNSDRKIERRVVLYPKSDVNGGLYYMEDITSVISGNVSGEEVSFKVVLNENTNDSRYLFLTLADSYGNGINKSSIYPERIELRGARQFSKRLDVKPSIYLATISDEEMNPYAKAIIKVVDVDFNVTMQDFRTGNFSFSVNANQVLLYLKSIKITVNNGSYGTYFQSGPDLDISLANQFVGSGLPNGNYTFDFQIRDLKKRVVLEQAQSGSWTSSPLFLFLGIAIAGALILLAPYLATLTAHVDYSLDIPDFPPLLSIKIPMKKSAVLGIIERVNDDYRWKNTPLKLEEIKKGFRKVVYQDKSVFISDYNLEYILDKLKSEGSVKSALDYYGLTKWEKDTGRSTRYLATYRKIRDMCINEAIPFTKIGESKEWDVKLDILGQSVLAYIMDSHDVWSAKLSLSMKQIHKSPVVLLFDSGEEKRDFEDRINSASESIGLVKLEVMNGSINLLSMDELEKMIKEMKTI